LLLYFFLFVLRTSILGKGEQKKPITIRLPQNARRRTNEGWKGGKRELTPWRVGIYTVLQILKLFHGRVSDADIRHERETEKERERESNCISLFLCRTLVGV
jgi:hypothetical protein